jgi:hypothetical protein
MVVTEWTGGAHCCLSAYVFELEPAFRLVARLDAEDDDLSHFEDIDGDGRFYYRTADWTFAYWPQSFAGSPSVPVLLRFVDDDRGGSYHLALDRMKQPALTGTAWRNKVADVRGWFDDPTWAFSGGGLWQSMLELIYSGNSSEAWKLADEGWPAKVKGKAGWLRDFCGLLKTSSYFRDLDRPLDGAPTACATARPPRVGG